MHIILCSSMSFAKEYSDLAEKLKHIGHSVTVPLGTDDFLQGKRTNNWTVSGEMLQLAQKEELTFLSVMEKADCVLVTNYEKNSIPGYIGGSTLVEMGIAFYLRKPIFLLYPIPDEKNLRYAQEIAIFDPKILNGNIENILL